MRNKLLVLSYAAVAVLAGCAREEAFEPETSDVDLIPLNISGSINQEHTKVNAQGFVDKDALGLFAVNYSENNTVAGTLAASGNQADNVKYVFNETEHTWTPVRSVYYKDANTSVDLYLYYPYQSSVNNVNAAVFEVQKNQNAPASAAVLSGYEASDFLWGKRSGVVPTDSKVAVSLSHKMAAVNVNLVEEDYFDEGEFASLEKSIILTNTTRRALIDYSTGEVTADGVPQADGIVMCPQEDGSFRAVVVPQSVAAGMQLFLITLGGVSYSFSYTSNDVNYMSGKQLDVNINVSKKVPSGNYALSLGGITITDWVEDINTHGGSAKQYYVVNVATPGSLGATIKADGMVPDKIKNLKVTGTVNNQDFYFMRDSMAVLEAVNMKEVELRTVDEDNYSPDRSTYVYNYSDDSKKSLKEQYGQPDIITYNSSGKELYYYWYPTDAKRPCIPNNAFNNKSSLYHFIFPEKIVMISSYAFYKTNLSGMLVVPESVEQIGRYAFYGCDMLTSLQLGSRVKEIWHNSFWGCTSMSGQLELPNTLQKIGDYAFTNCKFTGSLSLPNTLESIGNYAFRENRFTGDLRIPDKITVLADYSFTNCSFDGYLNLNNVQVIGNNVFSNCSFSGELVIPEGVSAISDYAFSGNTFNSIVFPSSMKSIGTSAFSRNSMISNDLLLPEGIMTIGDNAFQSCSRIPKVDLPSTLLTVGTSAFASCSRLKSIISRSTTPPSVLSGGFSGVDAVLEVPENSVSKYKAASGWSAFRSNTIGHYDFSIDGKLMSALNAATSNTYTIDAPSGFDWSIESKPDWVSVSPDHGTGKTEITVTVNALPQNYSGTFKKNISTSTYPSYYTYSGRSGEISFILDNKNYSFTLPVEQYDSSNRDGQVLDIQSHSKGAGVRIAIVGDGYDANNIVAGKFRNDVDAAYNAFFAIEPYASYKDYFDVRAVVSLSKERGITENGRAVRTKFGSSLNNGHIDLPDADACLEYAFEAYPDKSHTQTLVILLQNVAAHDGVSFLYGDDNAIACCPAGNTDFFTYIVQHEAGGHAFGKLADEFVHHGTYIQDCDCVDAGDHPKSDEDMTSVFGEGKARGWYKNLSMEPDMRNVPWSHLIFDSRYTDYVDMYEGGYMHRRGIYRSEPTSTMGAYNISYFSAISRQAIVERIMEYASETFSFEDFVSKDSREFGPITKAASPVSATDYTSREHQHPVYMGESPRFND